MTGGGVPGGVLSVIVGIRCSGGLGSRRALSGDTRVVLVHSLGASENVETSSIPGRTTGLLTASLEGVERRAGPGGNPIAYASPELYLGTEIVTEGDAPSLGLVRGVTLPALLVRRK